MIKPIITGLLVSLSLIACHKEDPFQVSAKNVGPLTQSARLDDIKVLFEKDSVAEKHSSGLSENAPIFEIYGKDGDPLLKITARSVQDSAKIQTVQILDPRYKTEAGITLNSTYKDIKDAYTISKIRTLLSSVMIFVDDLNAYFVIDKKELPGSLRYDSDLTIESSQIPDGARIKYFMIGW